MNDRSESVTACPLVNTKINVLVCVCILVYMCVVLFVYSLYDDRADSGQRSVWILFRCGLLYERVYPRFSISGRKCGTPFVWLSKLVIILNSWLTLTIPMSYFYISFQFVIYSWNAFVVSAVMKLISYFHVVINRFLVAPDCHVKFISGINYYFISFTKKSECLNVFLNKVKIDKLL